MKLKISFPKSSSHSAPVTCIGWSSAEEVYSAGDDNQLLSWSVTNLHPTKIAQFAKDLFPVDLQFLPRTTSNSLSTKHDLILITSANGKFHIINRTGRIERSVEAHKGAVLVGQWGNDGTGFLTAGEDGCIKVWSRSGMLRSTVVTSDNSIYSATWAPDSQSIAYTQGKLVVIKQLAPNTKPIKFKAHEGLVLALAWSPAADLIVSGGEDCKYRVWDGQGRQLFSSVLHDNHITAIAWAPNGEIFAVASFNTVRLCDYFGWSRSLDKPNTGCIYKIAWSADSTQLAAACANGSIFVANIVGRFVTYKNFTATVSERKIVTVNNVTDSTLEKLELPERIIQLTLRYNNLVVTTPTQCYIYNTNNWNTPEIFDLKDGSTTLLLLAEKIMLLAEKNNIGIYNYQGRLIASPRWPNMRLDCLKSSQISLASDTLAVLDSIDSKIIHLFDLNSMKSNSDSSVIIQHTKEITCLSLDQAGVSQSRNLAILDRNKDLHIMSAKNSNKDSHKLSRKIESFLWNSEENIIAAIQDTQLIVWYCPTAAFNQNLLKMSCFVYNSPELGRNPRISDFVGNYVSIRKADGSLLNISISPFPALLHSYIRDNKWSDALNLCRSTSTSDKSLWTCLAVLATQSNTEVMDIAEEAYASINQFDKVFYVQYVKTLPSKAQQKAAMALLGGSWQEAESILLHNGMVFPAIFNNVQMNNWTRALDLSVKHKANLDVVLFLRRKYLEGLGKEESNNKFVVLNEQVQVDEEKVQQKVEAEVQKFKLVLA